MSLSLLSVELLLSILPHLQYASDLNALSQTCCLFYTVFNPQLHSKFASTCNPNLLRLVKTGNSYALGKLLSIFTEDEDGVDSLDEETGLHLPVSRSGKILTIWSATQDDDCIEDTSWERFFIVKSMTQHYWRSRYSVPG